METLIIRHVAGSEPAAFEVLRGIDGKGTKPIVVPSPIGFGVKGQGDSDLVRELRWYLEEFLDYPFEPRLTRAERVKEALRDWGEGAYEALFGADMGATMFHDAVRKGYKNLCLAISSDGPDVLSWPWEAVRDPKAECVGQNCQVERRLNQVRDPIEPSEELVRDRVNILLVSARPYKADARFRSVSRPLIDLIEKKVLPAYVHLLRPPTFERLQEHLEERENFYHIVHFDGHGGYMEGRSGEGMGERFAGGEGCLVFEKAGGGPDDKTGEQVSAVLRDYQVPVAVLNACRSAMVGAGADDPFASVAASMIKAGIRSVVAMSYSLYVSGAEQFMPAFYGRFFETGSVAEAVRVGRLQMFANKERVCRRGRFELEDWLLPVLYQQRPADFSFAKEAKREEGRREAKVFAEAKEEQESPYGFVGRDGAILELERAIRRGPGGILICGLGGVGKTTLARGFVEWLGATEGLGYGCFWFRFDTEVRSAEYMFNRMGEALLGRRFGVLEMGEKIDTLAEVFKDNRFVIVWDNFEVVRGGRGTIKGETLKEADRELLVRFLKKLRGGASKVIITSRNQEEWLGGEQRVKVELGGLAGEERWEYCERILGDLGIEVDRDDEGFGRLMDMLDGHPLAMRVILPRLEKLGVGGVMRAVQSNIDELGLEGADAAQELFGTLRLAEDMVGEAERELLIGLAMHERFIQAEMLKLMAERVDERWGEAQIGRFFARLGLCGLVRERQQNVYEVHPVLTAYLRSRVGDAMAGEKRDIWARAFVEVMAAIVNRLAPKPLHEQRASFYYHGANFYYAMGEATRLGMDQEQAALLQGLGVYFQNIRSLAEAKEMFVRFAEKRRAGGMLQDEAAAYHQLGMIAQERRHFDEAQDWYRKALAVDEKVGGQREAGGTFHQLGMVAQEGRDFDGAEKWYQKALEVFHGTGREDEAAATCHQLGMIAQERRNFDEAQKWYERALDIAERLGDEYSAARSYHQLGIINQERRDFDEAERWYQKSLAIKEKLGDEHGASSTYHQLGMIAQERRDFDEAEKWYQKALAIEEGLGDEHRASSTYHQLGMIAQERRDFDEAERWYQKALAIHEKLGDEHDAATTYHQLGVITGERGDFDEAEKWYQKSLAIYEKVGNAHGAAHTYAQLGLLDIKRERLGDGGRLLVRSVRAFLSTNDAFAATRALMVLARLYERLDEETQREVDTICEARGTPREVLLARGVRE